MTLLPDRRSELQAPSGLFRRAKVSSRQEVNEGAGAIRASRRHGPRAVALPALLRQASPPLAFRRALGEGGQLASRASRPERWDST